MNTLSFKHKQCENLGKSLVGKKGQSRLLTELTANGKQKLLPAMEITGYEIVETFQEPTLMLFIGGESIFEDLIINIH